MPAFSQGLEKALHQALTLANERHHEYATLEHLLLALIDDTEAAAVMRACNVDLDELKHTVLTYIDTELDNLVTGYDEDSKPTAGFQRVIQRAVIHVQSSGREEVSGANVLVAIFAERESHAAYFLQEQQMTRYDAVNYISHGIAKRPGASETRSPRGADDEQGGGQNGAEPQEEGGKKKQQQDALTAYCVNLNNKAKAGKIDPLIGRESRDQPHHPGAVPPLQEQPALCRRSRRRQDGDRRGPRQAHRRGRRSRSAAQRHHLRARHGHAAGRHPLSRRFRGAAEAGRQGARGLSGRGAVHRRDPHRDRGRRHVGRRHGCVEPVEAGAVVRRHPLHRLDHLQGVPPVLREGPRSGAALPEDRRQRADHRGRHRDHEGPEALFRGVPQGEVTPTRRSRPRWNCRRATSTTASCRTRRST